MNPLEASELRYRRLFEGARDGILILDHPTLTIVDANPYIQELLEYSHDELLGRELWEIGVLKDQAESQRVYQELLERGHIRYDDLPLQSKAGHTHEVEFISNVYQEGDKTVVQCNIRDISQRKLVEMQRDRLMETEKLRLVGKMARGVAHDLMQSLGLVSGYSDLIIDALTHPQVDLDGLHDMVEMIAQAATDGGQILARLMTFARGQPEGLPQDVLLPELLTRVRDLTAPRWRNASRAEGRAITLYVDAEPGTVIVGWPPSLREALVNLVFNAIDAMPTGGTIYLRAYRQAQQVVVEVHDSGSGMPADVQAQIFRLLFTTKGPRGTGLGLAQVQNTVDHHGGQITVDSTVGRGTTFRLMFPAAHIGIADTVQSTSSDHAAALTILVVDDEPALADLLARMLRLDGHTVTNVQAGAIALERLRTQVFDLVISDLGMPSMDGWELAQQVRSRYPHLPVIIASGWGSQISPEEAREHGIQAVVAKPYRRRDVQDAIAMLNTSQP
jgi:PAS domain S-box-containing protein